MQAKDRLIFALDVSSEDEALQLVDKLHQYVGCFKIGLELFVAAGPNLVRQIVAHAPVFLDLKLHDIPATVGRAAAVANKMGVTYLTAHIDEGGRALKEAVSSAPHVGILGVTVLTSITQKDLEQTGFQLSLIDLVRQRAQVAHKIGCRGIICSGREASIVRQILGPDMLIITPGVRPADTAAEDQQRVVTPAMAIHNGADLIVVGRPIRDAADPIAVAQGIVSEIATALESRE